MFTVAKILELLPQEGSLEIKTLEKMLKLSRKIERTRLEIAIKALAKLGIIEQKNDHHIQKGNIENTIPATIRCSSKGYCFAVREDGEEDIYIREKFLNHAWHGDKVLVRISREGIRRRSPEGEVLCILERTKTNILGTINENNNEIIGKPLDERILSSINLPLENSRFIDKDEKINIVDIKINRYPIGQLPATGEIVRKLSLNNGPEGDLEIIKTKYNLLDSSVAPNVALKKPLQKNRNNLESQPCILFKSWSSKNCPLLPALYSEPSNGGMTLWIHIPTIGERLNYGSKLDEWIRNRSNSICFGEEWQCFLGDKLNKEAGFEIGKSNSAITLELFIDKNGKCQSWEFYLSTIKPVAKVSQKNLDDILKRKKRSRIVPASLKLLKDYINNIEDLLYISKIINENLIKAGLIQLDLPVPVIENLEDLDKTVPGGEFNGWSDTYKDKDPQSIISVFTKYANIILKDHFISYNISFIALKFKQPDNIQLNDVIKSALVLDTKINVNEEGIISFKDLILSLKESPNKRLIEKIISNTILDKYYSIPTSNSDDLGLSKEDSTNLISADIEAPWSSPGMNYADVINQFILLKLLNEGKSYKSKRKGSDQSLGSININQDNNWEIFDINAKEYLAKVCSKTNLRTLNTKKKQTKSFRNGLISMIQLRSVEKSIGKIIQGTITGVQSYGFFVEIDPSMSEGLVHVSTLEDDWYEYRSRQNLLIGRKNKKTFQIGDKVNVSIEKVDLLRNQIDLNVKIEDGNSEIESSQTVTTNHTK
ncbi:MULTISPECIES: RNB domain-containing ribonuclease [Prochlorococcus]|uniref:Exoribonuclease R n=1 Tax=Prochlorococcus marinus (strain SARG / CCMP1375 / SS120) TaxID=167539 RepID=Q7VBV4_PROMA|nr:MULTISPECIES: RNB domain-containing ribonuclease [Prochlorococcus]AAQ00033.1 Exoribonuclease R [Prochlorococcus marinus subsp. marinus str. CCMP1375]KGG13830.1 3'-to-5' exoribonuclease RNase R [Prochlorococcus marinus str. LG]KGG18964.1 3'-to-5' exoribonuclease RNase R [Prochlorococcus marinus str. SS2]KGG23497.1 3'-to-5' exoribonuclease RNase R [Prochlorococcus marinus str. SS35]KGG32267.1 3'-to-5' exoribonuclease RNase R [Prochlorococcus marinus str. SS51]